MPLPDQDAETLEQAAAHVIARAQALIEPGNHPGAPPDRQVRTAAAYDVNQNYGVAEDKLSVRLIGHGLDKTVTVPKITHLDVDDDAEPDQLGSRRPRRQATIAQHLGAGNCDHYAAFSWSMLRDCLPDRYVVGMMLANQPIAHRFAIVALAENFGAGTLVDSIYAVDPWPARAAPVLLRDHFSCAAGAATLGQSGLTLLFAKRCKGFAHFPGQFTGSKLGFSISHFMRTSRGELIENNQDVSYDVGDPHARYYNYTTRQ